MKKGDVLGGKYHLVERIGSGSYGVVWRAEQRYRDRLVKVVAVKTFGEEFDGGEAATLAELGIRPSTRISRARVVAGMLPA